ncbi:2-dehydropantoate 2-reductase [Paracoccidioides lutzii Pb01]|uniref:2-dehydropantoate 2-reductase n=1 Tax=Paracoccidioides lutzii (strain ATCC MYA-826 / Pb01) TaxID=502779 RepID=C1GSS0_PARBA|nr:2-dehydropantoate 2-reductase [Paracoccidioides lutzii Pb01]EEH39103.2 2-dehydropantoate 2-reductase [Paracoccidioides lutzii Pb01]
MTVPTAFRHNEETSSEPPGIRLRNILLVGSGGVGTIASLVLEKSRCARVTAILRSRYAVVKEKGWNIESVDHGTLKGWRPSRGEFGSQHASLQNQTTVITLEQRRANGKSDEVVSSVESAMEAETEPFDYVVVTTKQPPDVFSVSDLIRPTVTLGLTTVVLIQNGINIEVPVIEAFSTNTVMSSITMIGSRTEGENTIIQLGPDIQIMGPYFHTGLERCVQAQQAREFVKIYKAGREGEEAKCTYSEEMPVARWQKLLSKATLNTLCTLMRLDVGELLSSGDRESLLVPAMWEVHSIAKAAGAPPSQDMIPFYAYQQPDDCRYRPSMLLDLENGRPMELEVLLGLPLQISKALGVSTPILSTVYEALKVVRWKSAQESLKQHS